jgi:hypothetical protein
MIERRTHAECTEREMVSCVLPRAAEIFSNMQIGNVEYAAGIMEWPESNGLNGGVIESNGMEFYGKGMLMSNIGWIF